MPSRSRAILFVMLGAIIASAFSTSLAYLSTHLTGRPQALSHLAILNTTFWFGWALLSLPLVLLARRVRLDRRPRLAVPVHLVGLIGVSMCHLALMTTAHTVLRWQPANPLGWPEQWMAIFPIQLITLLDWELFAGAGIVGAAHAFFIMPSLANAA